MIVSTEPPFMPRVNGSKPLYFSFRNQVFFLFLIPGRVQKKEVVQRVATGWQLVSKTEKSKRYES